MGLFNKNTTIDTPFDNYKERQEERDRLLVDRIPASPIYMSQEAVFFLVSIVMSLFMKCYSIVDCGIWIAAVIVTVGLWSATIRLFISKVSMLLNVFVNTIFVFLCNLGIVYLYRFIGFSITSYDYFILSPLALGFMMISYEFHEEDYFDYKEDVLFPTIRGILAMALVAVINVFFKTTHSFVFVLNASWILLIMSRYESLIYKRDYLYAPVPPYSAFKSVPNKNPISFLRFFSYRIILLVAVLVSSLAAIIVNEVGKRFSLDLSIYSGLIVAVVIAVFIGIADLIPFFQSEMKNRSRNARFMKYYEYPFICAGVCLGLSFGMPYWKLGIYLLFLILLDLWVAGYMISLPRRLLFTNKSKYYSGAPAILVNLGLMVMVISLIFVIY